jgi:NAD(P)-dependent dehydrogenase (short-subunit alcohol dehydrogenase family)
MSTSEVPALRVVIVTGAGARQGIGFAACQRLARDGCCVAVTDIDARAATASAAELVDEGFDAVAFEADVGSLGSVQAMVAGVVDRWGQIDVLVNNAAIILRCLPEDLTDDQALSVLDVNLLGALRCAREAFPFLRQSASPAIVNVTSTTGDLGTVDSTAYAMSKGGLGALTRSLAVSWARFGIRVNAVAPGPVMTSMVHRQLERGEIDEERLGSFITRVPLQRWASPHEIAESIAFLAAPASGYVTGETLRTDGGLTVNGSSVDNTSRPSTPATHQHGPPATSTNVDHARR